MGIQAVTLFFSILPAHNHHSGVTQFLPTGGEKGKKLQYPPPSVNTGVVWEGAGGKG